MAGEYIVYANGVLTVATTDSIGNVSTNVYVHLVKCTLEDDSVVILKNEAEDYRDGEYVLPDGTKSVDIESCMLGDINANGSITLADMVLLRRYIAGTYEF